MIAAVVVPFGAYFNTEMYKAGELILLQANDSIHDISDPGIKSQLTNLTAEVLDTTESTIEINLNIFKYSWIALIVITGIVIFLLTRQLVEFSGGGFV